MRAVVAIAGFVLLLTLEAPLIRCQQTAIVQCLTVNSIPLIASLDEPLKGGEEIRCGAKVRIIELASDRTHYLIETDGPGGHNIRGYLDPFWLKLDRSSVKEQEDLVWTPTGCSVCSSRRDSVALKSGVHSFVEEARSEFSDVHVSPILAGDSIVVALAISDTRALSGGEFSIGNLADNVTIETASTALESHSLPYADPAVDASLLAHRLPTGDLSVKEGEFVQGFLFFPWHSAESFTVIVRLPLGQTFRFPFVHDRTYPELFVAPPAETIQPSPETLTAVRGGISSEQDPTGPKLENHVSFACADEFGVHMRTPDWVSNWLKKNAEKFPSLTFSQVPTSNGRNYLVVLSSSESAFVGFDAVVAHNTSTSTLPVTGTGTVIDNGYAWTFTFNGMATVTTSTTTAESVPYTVETKTSFVRVYDGRGSLISEHRRKVSTRQGGDSGGSIGYNSVAIMVAVLRRNGVLLNESMTDILKSIR